MPSDDQTAPADARKGGTLNPVDAALQALAPGLDEFRSAVATADEEVRAWRTHHQAASADPVGLLERELGRFAEGRLDARRLAGLMAVADAPDPLTGHLMDRAHELFASIMAGGRKAFHVRVVPGGDLRDAVRDALAELGRAFGMAHAVEKARDRKYSADDDHALLNPYPFHRWSPLEKELAPPLVVEVEGADLRAAGLVEFLDGWQKIVLVVRGKAPPAALARLVSPDVLVAQAPAEAGLALAAELAPMEGPGLVALFESDAGALPFVNRPGKALEVDREALTAQLEAVSRRRGQPGILELRHLASLSTLPAPVAAGSAPAGEKTVDQLAAWLLSRTDLD
ncbi:MAG: hypothetical protein RQ751_02145 [Longimicrobiales bacterium]|nr:hypothetical protein [Longimicrobiales bacterium]